MTADLRLINASNTSGEAVRSLVTVTRGIGAGVLTVDATTNWPAYFIATTGSLDTNGRLSSSTIQVFKGHKSGSTYIIDSFAPGYTDKGNIIGDVVLVKPTTLWADQISEFLGVSNNQDGTMKPSAVQLALQSVQSLDWLPTNLTVTSAVYNGNGNYTLNVSTDPTALLSPKMRMRSTRTVASPTQSALLNGTTQYFSKVSPATVSSITGDFTIAVWFKLASYPASGTASLFMMTSGASGGANDKGLGLRINGNGQFSSFYGNAGYVTSNSYLSVPLDKWVHGVVVVQPSSKTFTYYINGDAITAPAAAGTATSVLNTGNTLYVGASNFSSVSDFFQGNIAQAGIIPSALTATQVRAIYSQGLTAANISTGSAYSLSGATGVNDINTTNANNLVASGSATTTNANAPWGQQASGLIDAYKDYMIIHAVTSSTINVQVPEGNTLPTTGGISSLGYSAADSPYGFPGQKEKWQLERWILANVANPGGSGSNVVYNAGGINLNLPIGSWGLRGELSYDVNPSGAAIEMTVGLSTSPTAYTDRKLTQLFYQANLSTNAANVHQTTVSRDITLTVATPYYPVESSGQPLSAISNLRGRIAIGAPEYSLIKADNNLL